ncbi:histidine phosphatase family protein [Palleronia sediminis]|uniref:histidine phosphatase family protein n=1 Tax=Palleronia sediminis TaxID=2547833 RepID=UPI001F0F8ED8|nr:histidine phosphatase family protein [Palleronia sediminis]
MRDAIPFTLIRHAPVVADGRAYGRRDLPARIDPAACARLRAALPPPSRLIASPAARCLSTAAAIWPNLVAQPEPALLEQDLGAWEGLPLSDLPDIGRLDGAALATHRPPGGESFDDMRARVAPVLAALSEPAAIVAHAGTVRAALSLALGDIPTALRFEIAPLSVTEILRLPQGWVVRGVNRCP